MQALLREFKDVFAWSYQDMPDMDLDIVQHKLPLKPKCPLIKQKLRRMKPEMTLKIKEEVEKQFNAASDSQISPMGGKCCSCAKERHESTNVCGLSGFE